MPPQFIQHIFRSHLNSIFLSRFKHSEYERLNARDCDREVCHSPWILQLGKTQTTMSEQISLTDFYLSYLNFKVFCQILGWRGGTWGRPGLKCQTETPESPTLCLQKVWWSCVDWHKQIWALTKLIDISPLWRQPNQTNVSYCMPTMGKN